MTRSTASRRARNSDSVIRDDLRPESLPSRLRCFFASRRVEPLTLVGSLLGALGSLGVLTFTTTFGGNSPSTASPERRRDLTLRCEPSALVSGASMILPRLESTFGVGRSGALKISEIPETAGFTSSTGASSTFFLERDLDSVASIGVSTSASALPRLREGFALVSSITSSTTGISVFFFFTITVLHARLLL